MRKDLLNQVSLIKHRWLLVFFIVVGIFFTFLEINASDGKLSIRTILSAIGPLTLGLIGDSILEYFEASRKAREAKSKNK